MTRRIAFPMRRFVVGALAIVVLVSGGFAGESSAQVAGGTISGRVVVRCSRDGYVIVEEIRPLFDSPSGQALRVALTDIPDDGQKVYDHVHPGCRVLQYSSLQLAHQLGAVDSDGRVDITFSSGGTAYNSGAVNLIRLDVANSLGADAAAC